MLEIDHTRTQRFNMLPFLSGREFYALSCLAKPSRAVAGDVVAEKTASLKPSSACAAR